MESINRRSTLSDYPSGLFIVNIPLHSSSYKKHKNISPWDLWRRCAMCFLDTQIKNCEWLSPHPNSTHWIYTCELNFQCLVWIHSSLKLKTIKQLMFCLGRFLYWGLWVWLKIHLKSTWAILMDWAKYTSVMIKFLDFT